MNFENNIHKETPADFKWDDLEDFKYTPPDPKEETLPRQAFDAFNRPYKAQPRTIESIKIEDWVKGKDEEEAKD